jgi:hypothetical protein
MNLVLGIMLFSHKYVLDIYCGKSRDKDTKKKKNPAFTPRSCQLDEVDKKRHRL